MRLITGFGLMFLFGEGVIPGVVQELHAQRTIQCGDQTQLSSKQKSVFHPSTLFLWPLPFYFLCFIVSFKLFTTDMTLSNISHLNRLPWILCETDSPSHPPSTFPFTVPTCSSPVGRKYLTQKLWLRLCLSPSSIIAWTPPHLISEKGQLGCRNEGGISSPVAWAMPELCQCLSAIFYPSCEFWEVPVAHWSPAWPLSTLLHVPDIRPHYCGLSYYIKSGYLNG